MFSSSSYLEVVNLVGEVGEGCGKEPAPWREPNQAVGEADEMLLLLCQLLHPQGDCLVAAEKGHDGGVRGLRKRRLFIG